MYRKFSVVFISLLLAGLLTGETSFALDQPVTGALKWPSPGQEDFQVNLSTGSAGYTIPIAVPPGTNGMEPNPALVYNSEFGNDWIGVGWRLQGLGYIARSTKQGVPRWEDDSSEQDGDNYILSLDGITTSDLVNTINEFPDFYYQTKIDSFLYIHRDGALGWEVKDKNGTEYHFGKTNNSRVPGVGRPEPRVYLLNKVIDTHGNYMEIIYEKDDNKGYAYPKQIIYTKNDGNPITTYRVVDFVLESRPDISVSFQGGSKVIINKRLDYIKVRINVTDPSDIKNGQRIRSYDLIYANDGGSNSNRSLLSSVTQYGSAGTNHYPPIEFEYNTFSNAQFSDALDMLPVSGFFGFYDMNSDGLLDAVRYSSSTISYYPNQGEGYWDDEVIMDYVDDYQPYLADMDGDGFADYVTWYGTECDYYPNQGGTSWGIKVEMNFPGNPSAGYGEPFFKDMNGDGLADLAYIQGSDTNDWRSNPGVYLYLNEDGAQWGIRNKVASDIPGYFRQLADMNGDGLPDVVVSNGNPLQIGFCLNKGGGALGSLYNINGTLGDASYYQGLIDMNGDGLADYIMKTSGTSSAVCYKPGLLTGWGGHQHLKGGVNTANHLIIADIDGDIMPDIISDTSGGVTRNFVYYASSTTRPPNYLSHVTGEKGASVSFTYASSNEFEFTPGQTPPVARWVKTSVTTDDSMGHAYTTTYTYSSPYYDWNDSEFRGFNMVKVTDPEGHYTETYFHQDDQYKGLIEESRSYDSSGNRYTATINSYTYTEPYPGYEVYYIQLTTIFKDIFDGSNAYWRLFTEYQNYDDYGHPQRIIDGGSVGVTIDDRYIYNEYIYNTTDHIVDHISHTYTRAPDDNTKISETWYAYDNQDYGIAPTMGDLTRTMKWLSSGGVNSEISYEYDNRGNVIQTKDARENQIPGTGNIVITTYDSTYHTYPETITNALGHQTVKTYTNDLWLLKSVTDPNNNTTEYRYDIFGRLIKTWEPGDSEALPTVINEYHGDGTDGYGVSLPRYAITKRREISGGIGASLDSYTFLDGLGRTIQTKTEAEASGWITVDTQYNSRGLTDWTSVPYITGGGYTDPVFTEMTSYEYDPIGRTTQVTNPDGTYTTTEYDHWEVTTKFYAGGTRQRQSKIKKDGRGRTTKIWEYNNGNWTAPYATTIYSYDIYDAGGNRTETIADDELNVTSIIYDTLGRKKKMTDPDMGGFAGKYWFYTYDANGNMKTQTDAKGQTTSMDYDRLNRIIRKEYPNGDVVNYTYDDYTSGSNAIGRLSTVFFHSGRVQVEFIVCDWEGNQGYPDVSSEGIFIWENFDGSGLSSLYSSVSPEPLTTTIETSWSHNPGVVGIDGTTVFWSEGHRAYMADVYTGVRELVSELEGKDHEVHISGNKAVYTHHSASSTSDHALYVRDISSMGPSTLIHEPSEYKSTLAFVGIYPVISGDKVAWQDGRNATEWFLYGPDNFDIYGKNISSGAEFPISTALGWQLCPSISDNLVVWESYQNGTDWDIYMKDISTGVESAVSTAAGDQRSADISGNIVVWMDKRNYDTTGWDIYGKDIETGVEFVISAAPGEQSFPRISGNNVVWRDFRNAAETGADIYGAILGQDEIFMYSYLYDVRGRVKDVSVETGGINYSKSLTYDAMDRVSTITYAGGSAGTETVKYSYNRQGLLEDIHSDTYGMDYISNLDYNVRGQLTLKEFGNGAVTYYDYNDSGGEGYDYRLNHLWTVKDSTLQDLHYSYYDDGNVRDITDTVNSATQHFAYDHLDRVTSASSSASPNPYSYTYTYDTIGNMISVNGITYDYEDNAGPHALTFDDTYIYEYDYNGNMISRSDGRAFVYDYENRLKEVKNNGMTMARFDYDHTGRRIRKADAAQFIYYLDQDFEIYQSGLVRKWFFVGDQRIGMRNSDGTIYYYHPDHLGGANIVTDQSGQVKLVEYYPYGETRNEEGILDISYKFTGKELDSSTGLYYYGARYYDPAIAHFITADTVADLSNPQSLNRYSYCLNNPVKYVDPDGEFAIAAVLVGAWAVAEFALSAYDVYDTANTVLSSETSLGEKGLAVGLFGVGMVAPGGGYSKLDDIAKAGKAIKGGKVSKRVVVIGEGMADVKTTARTLREQGVNAKWYQAWGKNFPKDRMMTKSELDAALKRNERWIKSKVKKGYDIYDIGIDATQIKRSPFYQLETNIIKETNYPVNKLSR